LDTGTIRRGKSPSDGEAIGYRQGILAAMKIEPTVLGRVTLAVDDCRIASQLRFQQYSLSGKIDVTIAVASISAAGH
jgi:hypothetical protein